MQYEELRGIAIREKPCQELDFKSLQQRRRYRKLCNFYKIIKEKSQNIF